MIEQSKSTLLAYKTIGLETIQAKLYLDNHYDCKLTFSNSYKLGIRRKFLILETLNELN